MSYFQEVVKGQFYDVLIDDTWCIYEIMDIRVSNINSKTSFITAVTFKEKTEKSKYKSFQTNVREVIDSEKFKLKLPKV